MRIMLLCNAGLAIEYQDSVLLLDVPNSEKEPFVEISEDIWDRILYRTSPFDRVCGLFFTHNHADHYDPQRVVNYKKKWPHIPLWVPDGTPSGALQMGPFRIEFQHINHAPMDEPLPDHVVGWITAGENSIYLAADAVLDPEAHQSFLCGRVADAAFWNSMYLSRPETRALLNRTSKRNYIYHMPKTDPDGFGIWKKCKTNLLRYPEELKTIRVLKRYPSVLEV